MAMLTKEADIGTINAWYQTALDEWSDYRERARRGNKFYFGKQWDLAVEQRLRTEGKPALTMNKIKPIVRTLSGYQRQNRRDMYVAPRRGGVNTVASIYTELMKYIADVSYADWYNALAFTDGVIGGKGWVSIDRTFDHDPISGDIIIVREDPFLVLEDPFSQRYDMSDARFVFRSRWMEKSQIELMFPEVKDMAVDLQQEGLRSAEMQVETDDYKDSEKTSVFEISKNRYLVKECWYKIYKRKKFLVANDLEYIDVSQEDDDQLRYILTSRPDMKMIERIMPELNMCIVLGNTILHREKDPFKGSARFPLIRFCNELIYSEKSHVRGEVEDIISAQEEHNKRKSQLLHILNSTPNSGYIVERSALKDNELRKLQSMGSRPGVVVVAEDGKGGAVDKITPPQLSEGHVALSQMADTDMKAISGVNADLLGSDRSEAQSGVAMEMRRRQGLINLEPVFDNYDFSQRIQGDTLLAIIRNTDAYTPQEVAAIVGDKVKTLDGKPVSTEEVMAYMKTRKGMYGVAMSQKQNNPTIRMANFKEMIGAIKEAQIPVPPEMIVEASDWEFKDLWKEWFKTQQQAQPSGPGQPGPGQEPQAPMAVPPGAQEAVLNQLQDLTAGV